MNIDDIAADTTPGPEGTTFSFENVGDMVNGKVVHFDKFVSDNKYKKGQRDEVLAISLEQPDGSVYKIYPVTKTDIEGPGTPWADRKAKAIKAAILAAGETKLEEGATLAIKFNEEIPTDFGNPAKGYQAEYKAPVASLSVDGAVSGLISE